MSSASRARRVDAPAVVNVLDQDVSGFRRHDDFHRE